MVKLATYDEIMAGNPSKVEGETLEVIDPVSNAPVLLIANPPVIGAYAKSASDTVSLLSNCS